MGMDIAYHNATKEGESTMSKNIETMKRFVEAQNNHDSAAVVACFAPDFRRKSAETGWEEMGAGNYADMSDRYWAAFPDTHFEVEHLLEDGDFVFLQYMETGTWTGVWEMPGGISIPAQNTPYESRGIITCTMDENGLIRRYCYHHEGGFRKAYPILSQMTIRTINKDADRK